MEAGMIKARMKTNLVLRAAARLSSLKGYPASCIIVADR